MNADMKWLDNPEVFRVNQLDAHSDHCYYMDYADMEKSENPLMQSLNGQWEFAFSKNVMDRPENFYEENFDASSFDKIMVPGHIELAGYDKIRYINTMYPWEGKEYHRGAYSMGVPTLAAHFFVFYFGIVADITPPVALAAYAGSAIAKANPMKTAFTASKLAIAVFIVPYVFCFNPAMLLIDTTPLKVVQIFITSLIGVFGLSSSLEGFLSVKMSVPVRVLMAAGGLMLIDPSLMTDVVGILLIVGCCVWQTAQKKKTA